MSLAGLHTRQSGVRQVAFGSKGPVRNLKTKPERASMKVQSMSNNFTFVTAGGRIRCLQCQAKSKRTKLQCRAPASKRKTKCRFHGGASTGPKTEQGRQRCADARTIHGNETRKARTEHSLASARLSVLEQVGFEIGLMAGSRTRGRKPSKMGEAYPEIQTALRLIRASKASVL